MSAGGVMSDLASVIHDTREVAHLLQVLHPSDGVLHTTQCLLNSPGCAATRVVCQPKTILEKCKLAAQPTAAAGDFMRHIVKATVCSC